jgi:hypothetical protein
VTIDTLSEFPSFTRDQAEHWVAASLAEEKALRQHDSQLFADPRDPAARPLIEHLRDAWQHWAEHAEDLFDRIRKTDRNAGSVMGLHDLGYLIGRAKAMLQMTPDDFAKRLNQTERGEVLTIEEVRRELRSRDRG